MKRLNLFESEKLGNIGIKNIRETKKLITEQWKETGLLDGLPNDARYNMEENVAILFENQLNYLLKESTTSDSSGAFETVAFPVIRRVFARLLANEIVGVQALTLPFGRLYFINPKISKRTNNLEHYTADGIFSNAADNYELDAEGKRISKTGGTQFEEVSLYDNYYATEYGDFGSALFDRTNGRIFQFTSDTIPLNVAYNPGVTAKFQVALTGISVDRSGKIIGPVGTAADSEEFLASLILFADEELSADTTTGGVNIPAGSPIPFRTLQQAYGQELVINSGGTGVMRLELDLRAPDETGEYTKVLTGTPTTVFSARYRTYSDLEEDSEMAEVTFDFDFVDVAVRSKKLKATFTPEVQQDVAAFQSIDVEAELTALLSETISQEIDMIIMRDLIKGAAFQSRWNYRGYEQRIANGGVALTRKDYNQELITKINQIRAGIQKYTLRAGDSGNFWIVCSSEISAVFNDLEYFHATNAEPGSMEYSLGVERIGTLSNQFAVYVNVNLPANVCLIGYKGNSIFHTGYIYAPYVPLRLYPKVINPADFKTVLGIETRFATKMINNRFYGKVIVDGLEFFDPKDFLIGV